MGGAAIVTAHIAGRDAANRWGVIWAQALGLLSFTRLELCGRDRFDPTRSYVIMANHQSYFDIIAFYALWPGRFRWVMRDNLRRVPGLGPACAAMGHIFIDRSDSDGAVVVLQAAQNRFVDGLSVVFFPEGTCSRDGRLLPFKIGGFRLALDGNLPILPVTIDGSREVLPYKSRALRPGRVRIQIHRPIEVDDWTRVDRERLIAQTRTAIESGLTCRLGRGDERT